MLIFRRTVLVGSVVLLLAGVFIKQTSAQALVLPNPAATQPAVCTSYVSNSGSNQASQGGGRGTLAYRTIQFAHDQLKSALNGAAPTKQYAICVQSGTYVSDDYNLASQNSLTNVNSGSIDDVLLVSLGGSSTYPIWIMGDPQNNGTYPTLTQTGKFGIEFGPTAHDVVIAYLNVYGQALNSNASKATPALTSRSINAKSPYWAFYDGNCIGGVGNYQTGNSLQQIKAETPYDITIYNAGAYQCGGAGIAFQLADYINILNNQVMQNAYWSIYFTSGISLLTSVDIDTNTGYKMYIANNLTYGNQEFITGATDGEGVIVDTNMNSNCKNCGVIRNNADTVVTGVTAYGGRTLVANNVAVANGGPGIEATHSIDVDFFSNSTYLNANTKSIDTNGELLLNHCDFINFYNDVLESNGGFQPVVANQYTEDNHYTGLHVTAGNNDLYIDGSGTASIPSFITSHETIFSNPSYENPDPQGTPWNINLTVSSSSGTSGEGCDNSGVLCNTTTMDIQGNTRSGSCYPVGAYFKTH